MSKVRPERGSKLFAGAARTLGQDSEGLDGSTRGHGGGVRGKQVRAQALHSVRRRAAAQVSHSPGFQPPPNAFAAASGG